MNYIYNRFARVYYNQIIDIYKANNPATKKEKDKQLQEFISKKEYKEELKELEKNVTDKKMKLAIKYFFLKGKFMVKLFIVLNNIRKRWCFWGRTQKALMLSGTDSKSTNAFWAHGGAEQKTLPTKNELLKFDFWNWICDLRKEWY